MSLTNLIDNKDMIIVQGVNGICMHEESWVIEKQKKRKNSKSKSTPNKKEKAQ